MCNAHASMRATARAHLDARVRHAHAHVHGHGALCARLLVRTCRAQAQVRSRAQAQVRSSAIRCLQARA